MLCYAHVEEGRFVPSVERYEEVRVIDLKTSYMGIDLSNPILVGSSGLTGTVDGIRRCADAGAGAVVMKSLFETHSELSKRGGSLVAGLPPDEEEPRGDAGRGGPREGRDLSRREYLETLYKAKRAVTIPVIASLCCDSIPAWKRCARAAWNAGADALELNISVVPRLTTGFSKAIEDLHIGILEEVKREVGIPVSIKISPYLTSMMRLSYVLSGSQVSALVLFNRFYRIDMDIEKLRVVGAPFTSSREEMYHGLRWIALLHGKVPVDLAAATGLHEAEDVIKQLLAGARAVQLCSTLYRNGLGRIRLILDRLSGWMSDRSFTRIDEFRGLLSQDRSDDPAAYERVQYATAPLTQG